MSDEAHEIEEVAFALWASETGNGSRAHWYALSAGYKMKWIKMARAAIERLDKIRSEPDPPDY